MVRHFVSKNFILVGALGFGLVIGLIALGVNLRAPRAFHQPLDVADPGVELRTVLVYYLEPDSLRLVPLPREVSAEEGRPGLVRDLVEYLSRSGGNLQAPLPAGTELMHYFEADAGSIVLDFNQAISDVRGRSIEEERLRLSALARTLAENVEGVRRIRLLVLGTPLERWGRHLRPEPWLETDAW